MHDDKLNIGDDLIQRSWEDMESILDREMPVRKRRLAVWLPLAAMLIILILAGGAFLYNQIAGNNITPEEQIAAREDIHSAPTNPSEARGANEDILQDNQNLVESANPLAVGRNPGGGVEENSEKHSDQANTADPQLHAEQVGESGFAFAAKQTTHELQDVIEKTTEIASVTAGTESQTDHQSHTESLESINPGQIAAEQKDFRENLRVLALDQSRYFLENDTFLKYTREIGIPESAFGVDIDKTVPVHSFATENQGFWTYGSVSSYEPNAVSGIKLGLAFEKGITNTFGVQMTAGINYNKLYWEEGRDNLASRFGGTSSMDTSQDPNPNSAGENVNTPTRQIEFRDYLSLVNSAWFFETGLVLTTSIGKLHVSTGPELYYTISATNDTELGVQSVSESFLDDNDYINRLTFGLLGRLSYDITSSMRFHISYDYGLSNLYGNLETPPAGFQNLSAGSGSQSTAQLKNRYLSFGVLVKL